MTITDACILRHRRSAESPAGLPNTRLDLLTISTDEGSKGHTFVSAPGCRRNVKDLRSVDTGHGANACSGA